MIPIRKTTEPRGLRRAKRQNRDLRYEIFADHVDYREAFKELRLSLLQEQGSVCCYCQQNIAFKDDDTGKIRMKTEHFIPKNGPECDESKDLDYDNLLAACLGNSDSDKPNHCDSSKDQYRLKVLPNPAIYRQSNYDAYLRYRVKEKEGEVIVIPADPDNEELRKDIEERLNLNEQNLMNARFNIWKQTWQKVEKAGKVNIQQVKEVLEEFRFDTKSQNGQHKPFCGFIIHWYQKRFKNELAS